VSVVLAHLVNVDLFDRNVRESGVVEEPARRRGQRLGLVLYTGCNVKGQLTWQLRGLQSQPL
jgi:hypothetical protein